MTIARPFQVAVVIPLFNKAPFIRRTLKSVLAQTHSAAEVFVIDDGSTDGSVEAITDLLSSSVRLVRQRNAGPGPARNRGIAETRQPWIAFLDGDDLWRADHLSTLAVLANSFPSAGLLSTGFRRCSPAEQVDLSAPLVQSFGDLLDLFAEPLSSNPLCASSACVSRSAFKTSGAFGDFCPGEDFELWARLALDHVIAVNREPTAIYVRGTAGIMDRFEEAPRKEFALQPIFATLDCALADPRYAGKHTAISHYRDAVLRENVRQALYGGAPAEARAYARLISDGRIAALRPLCWLPAPVLRAGLRARAAVRHAFG